MTIFILKHYPYLLIRSGQNLKGGMGGICLLDVHHEILRGLFYYSHLAIRHKILHKLFFLVWHQPGKVGLVLGINTCHQLDIGTEALAVDMPLSHLLGCSLICEVAVPSATKVAVTPSPLFLAWRVVVTGHMQHACLGIVLVTTLKIET